MYPFFPQWSANRGLLSLIRDETCLESLVGLFAGSLYHIQKQAQVPSMLLVEGYGHLAQLASRDSFHDSRFSSTSLKIYSSIMTVSFIQSSVPTNNWILMGSVPCHITTLKQDATSK